MEVRRLAAIMFTDIVGYTALMGSDEKKAFQVLHKNRNIHKHIITKYKGKFLKEIGDGILASFDTASDAVRCAGEIQNRAKKEEISLRIGIHEGEVVFEGNDVFGDGVNVASRLEELADPGSTFISGAVYKDIKNKEGICTEFMEERTLKNVDEPLKVYSVECEEVEIESTIIEEKIKVSGKKVPYYILAGLMVIIVGGLIWYLIPKQPTTEIDKSIAIIPFRNDSHEQGNEYFCNGMVESILTNLQKIGELKVKSRTDAEQYRNPDKDLKAVARELKVAFILEGSVQKVGDNIRVTAQLIDGSTGDHLWADNYDGQYTDEIFTFQSNVAKKVASSLKAVIAPEEEERIDRKSTSEIMAYDLVWRGWDMLDEARRTGDQKYGELALELFDKALRIDPNYWKALHGKGKIHYGSAVNKTGLNSKPLTLTSLDFDSAIIYADKVIQLAPDEADGYSLKGDIYSTLRQSDLAIENYMKVMERNPSNWDYIQMGRLYCEQKNDYIRGIPYIDKAVKLEGRLPSGILFFAGRTYQALGEYEKADEYFKHSINLIPNCFTNIPGYFWVLASQGKLQESKYFIDSICNVVDCETDCSRYRFWAHTFLREYDLAVTNFKKFVEGSEAPDIRDSVYLAFVFEKLGKEHEAMNILENTRSALEDGLNETVVIRSEYYSLASIYCLIGNKGQALSYLIKAVDVGRQWGQFNTIEIDDLMEIDPTFENLHDDPEFKSLAKRAQDEKITLRKQIQQMEKSGELNL